jgi:hypothetical protein
MDYQKSLTEFKLLYRTISPRPAKSLLKQTAAQMMGIAEATIPQKVRDTRNFSKLEIEKIPEILEKFKQKCKERGITYESKRTIKINNVPTSKEVVQFYIHCQMRCSALNSCAIWQRGQTWA